MNTSPITFTASQKDLIQLMQKNGCTILCNNNGNILRNKSKSPIRNLRTSMVQSLLDRGFLSARPLPRNQGFVAVLSFEGKTYQRKVGRPALV